MKPKRSHRRRPMRGGSRLAALRRFLSKADQFLRKHKAVSRTAALMAPHLKGTRFARAAPYVGAAGKFAKTRGYGLRVAGNGLRLAGNGCGHYRKTRRRRK